MLEVSYVAAPRNIGVNHENLIDALQALDSTTITIMLGEDSRQKKSPLFLEDGDTVAVLQQLRL